jgi:hypothetical protein
MAVRTEHLLGSAQTVALGLVEKWIRIGAGTVVMVMWLAAGGTEMLR